MKASFRLVLLCAVACCLYAGSVVAKPSIPRSGAADAERATLAVANMTEGDLLGVRFLQNGQEHFARLDLAPGMEDVLENPGGSADLRLDMGFELWFFDKVPLGDVERLAACDEKDGPCLVLTGHDSALRHFKGRVQSLLPVPGARPVCELTRFHPGMRMEDACALVEPQPQRDDNDAVLTSLGFAGLVWAARLSPGRAEGAEADSGHALLDHVELRQRLTPETLTALRKTLADQGYRPWQAEFPGMDLNFMEMSEIPQDRQTEILENAVSLLMASEKGEGSLMLAPAAMLPALANADGPQGDVQLFTITLNRASRTLIVDMAAYSPNI